MNFDFGKKVEELAKLRGYSQAKLGEKISLSKPGVASMYKRSSIDTDILAKLTEVLDYDFFVHAYENESIKKFKDEELYQYKSKIENLIQENESLKKLVTKNDQIIDLQFKRIAELEEKLKQK